MTTARASNPLITAATVITRIVVGGTFAFSGFAKAIDPWGTYYKITDYLLALGWDSALSLALWFAFVLAGAELLLGVLITVGAYRRSAPIAALLTLLVMTPLTLWLAITNAVPDCGCFGDALVLSNWATFAKNLLLLAGTLFLILSGTRVRGLFYPATQWLVAAATIAFAAYIAAQGYFVQPLLDFRPFKTGTRITADAHSSNSTDFAFIYERGGQRQQFTIDNVPDEDSGWTFIARVELPPKAPAATAVDAHTLALADEAGPMTDQILASDSNVILILFPNLSDVSVAHTYMINEITDFALDNGAAVYGVTAATDNEIAQWADLSMARYPMLFGDDSEIKMLARGNPAIVLLSSGEIRWKRTLGSITPEHLRKPQVTLHNLSDDFRPREQLRNAIVSYAIALLAILVLNHTYTGLRHISARRKSQPQQQNNSTDNNTNNN